jgi:hypothetical protein
MKDNTSPTDPTVSKILLLLIREELKNRKLFLELHWLGYNNSFYQADLLDLIMLSMNLQPGSSLQRSICHTLLDKHSQRVVANAAELLDEAKRVHEILTKHASFIAKQHRQPHPNI